ncbi:MAG: hypothetical protein P4L72_02650 [Parvibaculum sp.]|uniref:hypothetical protein n=1 Tax=Parvibaculum sp. TaxID=2024848 RepID=UPI0028424BE5|nr:hypothetical protein [Parvibaculum sp.]MDR3498109.1 hypothetical protein [Parvibaculum sp.]
MNLIIPEKTKELPSPKDNATTPGLVHRLHHPTKQNLTTIVCRLNSVDDIHWDDLPELDVCHLQYADMFSPVLHRLKTIETEEPITHKGMSQFPRKLRYQNLNGVSDVDLTQFPGKDHATAYGDAQALSGTIADANGRVLPKALADLIGSDAYKNQMTDAPGIGGRQDALEGVIHQYRKTATDLMVTPSSPYYRKDIADALRASESAFFRAHVQQPAH